MKDEQQILQDEAELMEQQFLDEQKQPVHPSMPDLPCTGDIEDYQYFRKCHEKKYFMEDK